MGHKPTALDVLNTSINGPALPNQDDRICETCGSVGAEKRSEGKGYSYVMRRIERKSGRE